MVALFGANVRPSLAAMLAAAPLEPHELATIVELLLHAASARIVRLMPRPRMARKGPSGEREMIVRWVGLFYTQVAERILRASSMLPPAAARAVVLCIENLETVTFSTSRKGIFAYWRRTSPTTVSPSMCGPRTRTTKWSRSVIQTLSGCLAVTYSSGVGTGVRMWQPAPSHRPQGTPAP
jgi:hypothetical protein